MYNRLGKHSVCFRSYIHKLLNINLVVLDIHSTKERNSPICGKIVCRLDYNSYNNTGCYCRYFAYIPMLRHLANPFHPRILHPDIRVKLAGYSFGDDRLLVLLQLVDLLLVGNQRVDGGTAAVEVGGYLFLFSTVNVFCSKASPLYFSFVKMDFTVLLCHFSLPAGEGIPFLDKRAAMPEGVFPSRNMP